MRPVDKGVAPKVYTKYNKAQPDLIQTLGRFCSYCERHIPSALAVEHKRPKSIYRSEELKWDNFLLSCSNCNSAKTDKKINLSLYLWPDSDNTFRAFEYKEDGLVRIRKFIPKRLRRKASRTLFLVGLDRYPGGFRVPTDRDYRWKDRQEAWKKALIMRCQLKQHDTPEQRDLIVIIAKDSIFSIWMEVFKQDVDMQLRLIKAFPGTAMNCFNGSGKPVARPGGSL